MKRIKPFVLILIFAIFIGVTSGCSPNNEKLEISGGKDGTDYIFEQTITVSCCDDPEYQDSVFCDGEANDPILYGRILEKY